MRRGVQPPRVRTAVNAKDELVYSIADKAWHQRRFDRQLFPLHTHLDRVWSRQRLHRNRQEADGSMSDAMAAWLLYCTLIFFPAMELLR